MRMRSLLFVPAKEKMVAKIEKFDADGYIIDLEDSIEEENKKNALETVCRYMNSSGQSNIWIRINKNRINEELSCLSKYNVGFMIPKIEQVTEFEVYKDVLMQHNVIALIETPKSLLNIEKILNCSFIDAVAFGAEDYTASMNMVNNLKNLQYPQNVIVTYAKAAGKPVYDTPSFKINDFDSFKEEVLNAVDMGFDGKLCINPNHIEFINKSFNCNDIDYIKYVINTYEQGGEALKVIDGVVYEKMHINRLKKILKESGVI